MLSCLYLSNLWCQIPQGGRPTGNRGNQGKPMSDVSEELDTTIYNFFYFERPMLKRNYADTLLDRIDQYDPSIEFGNEHLTLGNLGSASHPFRYSNQENLGLEYGFDQYDLYNFKLEDIKLFEQNRPLNDLYFTPLNGQANFQVKALFSRRFANDVSFHLNYRRINQTGFYQNQFTKTTNLTGAIYIDKKKYRGMYSLVINNNNEENNGGIDINTPQDSISNPLYRRRTNVPIFLIDANSRKEERIYSFKNDFNLFNSKNRNFGVYSNLLWNKGSFRSSDDGVSTDSTYYKSFLVDDRGLRSSLRYNQYQAQAGAFLNLKDRFDFRGGIKFKHHNIHIAGNSIPFNELILEGSLLLNIQPVILDLSADLGLADLAGDFNLKGIATIKNDHFILSGGVRLYRFTPTLKSERLAINDQLFWDQNWLKPFGTELFGSIEVPLLNLKGELKQIVETNSIYYDSTFQAKQFTDVLSITQLSLSHHLKLGPVGIDNDLFYQLSSKSELSLPNVYLQQRLYFQFKMFSKNLETQFGLEGQYMNDFKAYSYLPLTATFGNTDERIKNYYRVNAYTSMKVSQFRFFVRYENLSYFWEDIPFSQVLNNPHFDYNFRLGVRWILKD